MGVVVYVYLSLSEFVIAHPPTPPNHTRRWNWNTFGFSHALFIIRTKREGIVRSNMTAKRGSRFDMIFKCITCYFMRSYVASKRPIMQVFKLKL